MEAAIGLKPLKIGNLVAKHPVIQGEYTTAKGERFGR